MFRKRDARPELLPTIDNYCLIIITTVALLPNQEAWTWNVPSFLSDLV